MRFATKAIRVGQAPDASTGSIIEDELDLVEDLEQALAAI